MAPVARVLSEKWGTLEPLQTEITVNGQVRELYELLSEKAALPTVLIGHSWGAMLGFIFAARYPKEVKKLILVGSGTYEAKYARNIMDIRMSRLTEKERNEMLSLMGKLNDTDTEDKNDLMADLGKLTDKVDSYDPLPDENEVIACQYELHNKVWQEANELRNSGEFLKMAKDIRCPVVAIHGNYDPHLAAGIREPLSAILKDFRFILIENCGHTPWIERTARDNFYRILGDEIAQCI
ncbi:alpha/beta fold hydrolase [Chloroflexota bacterium]